MAQSRRTINPSLFHMTTKCWAYHTFQSVIDGKSLKWKYLSNYIGSYWIALMMVFVVDRVILLIPRNEVVTRFSMSANRNSSRIGVVLSLYVVLSMLRFHNTLPSVVWAQTPTSNWNGVLRTAWFLPATREMCYSIGHESLFRRREYRRGFFVPEPDLKL
jgi:hypothetical protein